MKTDYTKDGFGYLYRSVRVYFRMGRALVAAAILGATALSWGCAGFVAGQNQTTYTISGTISPSAGGNGATVTLRGGGLGTANTSGAFTFTGLGHGTYTINPTRTGYTFISASPNA